MVLYLSQWYGYTPSFTLPPFLTHLIHPSMHRTWYPAIRLAIASMTCTGKGIGAPTNPMSRFVASVTHVSRWRHRCNVLCHLLHKSCQGALIVVLNVCGLFILPPLRQDAGPVGSKGPATPNDLHVGRQNLRFSESPPEVVGAFQRKVDGDVVSLNESSPQSRQSERVHVDTTKVLFVFPFVQEDCHR